jgi:hypothetical protein
LRRLLRAVKRFVIFPFRLARRVKSKRIIAAASRKIHERRSANLPLRAPDMPLSDLIVALLSYRITNEDRLRIFSIMLSRLGQQIATTGVSLRVEDSSDPAWTNQASALLKNSAVPVLLEAKPEKLCEAYADMLRAVKQKYFYLQFDDFITVGLSGEFLRSCCELLEKYSGLVNVIPIMWPRRVEIVDEKRAVEITSHEILPAAENSPVRYHFGFGEPVTPLFTEKFGDFEFGIFENFQYGFFFNHLVAPVADYAERLAWFMENVSSTSVHQIELAASQRTVGPFFTHLAICLGDVCLLDLDYAHTAEAVRPQVQANRLVCNALEQGFRLQVHNNSLPAV